MSVSRMVMGVLLIILIAGGVFAALAGMLTRNKDEAKTGAEACASAPASACGSGACAIEGMGLCELEANPVLRGEQVVYYDDEELDAYAGLSSDAYTDDQTQCFRDVFDTMQETDVSGWVHSLQMRGIQLPDDLKDEVFMVLRDRKQA